MVSGPQDEFLEMLKAELSDPKYQEELRMVITQRPENYRKKVEAQELGMENIMETEEGYRQNNKPAPQGAVDAALKRADERMLRESPLLQEKNLKFSGGMLVPDIAKYKKMKAA
jgi:hypothetical protein